MSRRKRWGVKLFAVAVIAVILRPKGRSTGYRQTPFWRLYDGAAQLIDRRVGWDHLPTWLGLPVLVGLRNILRKQNLHDTAGEPMVSPPLTPLDPRYLAARTVDGSYNDLERPAMGMAGTRFGRNIPIDETYPESEQPILTPNPRTVSRELMTREQFQPATSVNLLAAAWIQFMVKDWFNHGKGDADNAWMLPLAQTDPWPEVPMLVPRTVQDPTRPPDSSFPPTFNNFLTHWWDASQIYGTSQEEQAARRSGQDGKLAIGEEGLLVLPDDPLRNPAMVPGWWLGIEMMATLFVREHNVICDRLLADFPLWSDDEIFARARLINAALMAKIHTVDWTPAIISHPTTIAALRVNWFGVASERVRKAFGRISRSEIISGIPGSETDHYGIPYSLTEEFTVVYRMHQLMPDDYTLRSAADDSEHADRTLRELSGPRSREITDTIAMDDLFYSFGTSHPGAIVLHNFPRFLQEFERQDGHFMDLAAIDILRSRELGVPRYNRFRNLLHLRPATSFEEITDNPTWADELRSVYNDNLDDVDLISGMLAERRPKGFAFSDTAFRIFILMASRRLNSDRFFTRDFTSEVYTPAGMDWITDNDFRSVLLRHCPAIRPAIREATNGFHPWMPVGRVRA